MHLPSGIAEWVMPLIVKYLSSPIIMYKNMLDGIFYRPGQRFILLASVKTKVKIVFWREAELKCHQQVRYHNQPNLRIALTQIWMV